MPTGKPTTTATKVPLSTDFCADDADVVIRAAGALDFRVHKIVLSLASPVFKDMFTLPQPPPDKPGTLPHVDVQDPPKAWEIILQTIYPNLPNPKVDTLDDLESLLHAALAYEMHSIIETYKKAFEDREFVEEDPLYLFVIACACGFEDQAAYVARNAELLKVTRRPDPSDLRGFTLSTYCQLVSFLVERDNKWREITGGVPTGSPYCSHSDSQSRWLESFYNSIGERLLRPCLRTEEVYLKALEDRSCCGLKGCYSGECQFGNLKISRFIQERIEKKEKVCDELQPEKWYYPRVTTLHPP